MVGTGTIYREPFAPPEQGSVRVWHGARVLLQRPVILRA
jgi:hypothetical protein